MIIKVVTDYNRENFLRSQKGSNWPEELLLTPKKIRTTKEVRGMGLKNTKMKKYIYTLITIDSISISPNNQWKRNKQHGSNIFKEMVIVSLICLSSRENHCHCNCCLLAFSTEKGNRRDVTNNYVSWDICNNKWDAPIIMYSMIKDVNRLLWIVFEILPYGKMFPQCCYHHYLTRDKQTSLNFWDDELSRAEDITSMSF